MAKQITIADVHADRASITPEQFVERKLRYVNQEWRRLGRGAYMGLREYRAAIRNAESREARERLLDAIEAEFAQFTSYAG